MQVVAIAGRADEGHRAAGALPGGPLRQHRGQRQHRPRPATTTPSSPSPREGEMLSLTLKIIDDYGAYFQFAHGQHGNAMAQPTGPVPDRQPALRRRVRAHEQGAAGLLPRRRRRPRQLHPRTAGRRGRRGARHRPRRASRRRNFIQPDAVPVQDPDRQHVRQRQLRGRARPGAGASPTSKHWRAEQETAARRGALHRHRPGSCQERTGYNASEWWFLYDNPPLPATSTPGEREAARSTPSGGVPRRAGLPAVGQQPGDRRQPGGRRGVRHRPGRGGGHLRRLDHGRDVGRPGRQPSDDHAVRRGPRRGAHDPGQDDPHRRARDGGRAPTTSSASTARCRAKGRAEARR